MKSVISFWKYKIFYLIFTVLLIYSKSLLYFLKNFTCVEIFDDQFYLIEDYYYDCNDSEIKNY